MTVNRGLWVPINTGNVGTTEVEARLADGASYESNDGVNARSGILAPQSTVLVTGTAGMSYNLGPCDPVINRVTNEGVYRFTCTGTTAVATTAAPAANSRYDVIYVKQNDQSKGDANNLAVAGVVQGTVAASPTVPAVPAGAIEVARALVGPNITGTNAASITQTFRYAALIGSPIPVRNTTERAEITAPRLGQSVRRLDIGPTAIETWDGAAWVLAGVPQSAIFNAAQGIPANAQWGCGSFTLDAANSQNSGIFTTPGADKIQVAQTGIYAIHWHMSGLAGNGGWMAIKNVDLSGTYTLINFPTGGEQAVSIPNLYLVAGAVVNFVCRMNTAATLAGSSVRITKIG